MDAGRRELHEEVGLAAGRFELLGGEVHISNCISNERAHFFLAQDLKDIGAAPEVTEQLQVRKVPLRECLDMIERGKLQDAMSIIALQRAARLFGVA